MIEQKEDEVVLVTVWPPLKAPTVLTKFEVAERELEVAARLYLAGHDYIAVLNLAGAAEEILGQLLRRYGNGKQAMIERLVDLDRELTGGRPFKEVSEDVNRARNAIKHARDPDEDHIVVIEPGDADAMLWRALVNYLRLAGKLTDVMERARDNLSKQLAAETPPPKKPTTTR